MPTPPPATLAEAWKEKGDRAAQDPNRDPEEALSLYQHALRLDPELTAAYAEQAMILGILGRYDEAMRSIEMALARDPRQARALAVRSKLLAWIAARQLPDQIPVDLVETADTCLARAVALVEKGAPVAEALAWVEKALQLSPKHREARETLAGYLLRLGRFDEAMIEFDRLFRGKVLSGRRLAHAEWSYAVCLREVGRFEEALIYFDRAGRGMPGNLDLARDRAATVEGWQRSRT